MQALAPTNEPLLLYIRATDGIDHGAADPELQVRVFLRDINDNLPQFVNVPRTVTFPEVKGALFFQLTMIIILFLLRTVCHLEHQ